jgi:hypothetical protein
MFLQGYTLTLPHSRGIDKTTQEWEGGVRMVFTFVVAMSPRVCIYGGCSMAHGYNKSCRVGGQIVH